MEKIIFDDAILGVDEYEDKWIQCKQDLSRDILRKIIEQDKVFGTTIIIPLNFTVEGIWITRLTNFLTNYLVNPIVESDKVIITISETNDLNKLKKDINNLKSEIEKHKSKLLDDNHILDENKTVVWNRQEVKKINGFIRVDIKLLNGLQWILLHELLNVFVNRVKKEYALSISDELLFNMLHEIVPYFNLKDAESVSWKTIRRKMNVIMMAFNGM